MPQPLPKQIGRYQILGELGRGAMGVVYKALDPNIDRTIALKTMRLDVHGVGEEEMLARFKHEAKLAGVMNHPNIVTIYDAGEFEGVFYMAMEFVEGATLQKILDLQKVLPVHQVLEVSHHVCSGLDYAHERKVIHRDIKPANIMISPTGAVKIMDFGIAKSGASMTSAGQVLGTPTYMSPEQVRGRQLDGRTDLFSYGVVLYEMVTGEKPFAGQNVTTIIYKIMNEEPIPPRILDESIHPGLSSIVSKALAKRPEERYQSGAEIIRDLMNYKAFGSTEVATSELSAASQSAPASPDSPTVTHLGKPARTEPAPKPQVAGGAKPLAGPPRPVAKQSPAPHAPEAEHTQKLERHAAAAPAAAAPDYKKFAIIGGAAAVVLLLALGLWKMMGKKPESAPAPSTQQAQNGQTQNGTSQPPAPDVGAASQPTPAGGPQANPPVPKQGTAKKMATAAATPAKPVPEEETAPATSDLVVSSTPAGAKVTIGGSTQPDWVTPFTADKMPPGTYEVIFSKPGYRPEIRSVRLAGGKNESVAAVLGTNAPAQPADGKLSVNSTPPGGDIYLDGKPTGKKTPAELSVDPGEHQVEVRKAGYQESAVETSIGAGEKHDFSPVLQVDKPEQRRNIFKRMFGGDKIPAGMGMLVVNTTPAGATIFHNGKAAEKATPIRYPMEPGKYRITLRLEGFKPAHREFTIEEGKITRVDQSMDPK